MVFLGNNWNHSVIFEITPKYCTLDIFVDYEGCSISSKWFLSTCMHVCCHFSCVQLFETMDYSLPGPLSMGFFREKYWSELPCPPTGDHPNSGGRKKKKNTQHNVPLMSPALLGGFFTTSATWEFLYCPQ